MEKTVKSNKAKEFFKKVFSTIGHFFHVALKVIIGQGPSATIAPPNAGEITKVTFYSTSTPPEGVELTRKQRHQE